MKTWYAEREIHGMQTLAVHANTLEEAQSILDDLGNMIGERDTESITWGQKVSVIGQPVIKGEMPFGMKL